MNKLTRYSSEVRERAVRLVFQAKAMRADRDLAHSKLRQLRTANESAWQQMQSDVTRPKHR